MGMKITRQLTPEEVTAAVAEKSKLAALAANETALDLAEMVLALQDEVEKLKGAKANG